MSKKADAAQTVEEEETTEKADEGSTGGPPAKKLTSRSSKAGLVWPIQRVHSHLSKRTNARVKRVGGHTPVYLAAVIEFFAQEVLEAAARSTNDSKQPGGARRRINVKDLVLALRTDRELCAASAGLIFHVSGRLAKQMMSSAFKK